MLMYYRPLFSTRLCQISANLCRSIEKLNYGEYTNVRLARFLSGSSSEEQINLKQNMQNIINSPFSNIKEYENVLLHEIIWRDMEKWPNKTAVVCASTGRSYTYQQLRKYAGRLATSLRKAKLLENDTITIILPNIPEYIIIMLGAMEAGLRISTINPLWTSMEIKKQINDSETSAIFTNSVVYPTLKKSIENISHIKLPIVIVNDKSGPIPLGTINLDDLMKEDIEEFSKNQKIHVNSEDDAFLLYSSGTTGLPKGVQLTHRNICASIFQISHPEIIIAMPTTETMQDVVPVIIPFFHVYALVPLICYYLRLGAKLVCMPQFSIENYIKVLENYKPTLLYVVPPIIQMIINNEQITSRHFESVRYIISGAAPIGISSINKFHECISKVRLLQGYGMTETSSILTFSRNAPSDTVGFVTPNTQLRIVKYKDGKSINAGPNEIGEIYIKGPQIMKSYHKNPQATQDIMDGDWLKTGDLGKYDESEYIYIEGRTKELIKVKGFQVAPAELENIIRDLDNIADVAVIGVPHDKYGEIPKAFIVPKKGVTINPEEVKNFVAKQVSKYKQIGHVQCVNEIPKNPSGKILRNKLQNM